MDYSKINHTCYSGIWSSVGLTTNERILLLFFASHSEFPEFKSISINEIIEATSLGRSTVSRLLRKLQADGFILKERCFEKTTRKSLPSEYALTSKIFDEYALYLKEQKKEAMND